MVKHCCYGQCRSDSRHKDRPHMTGVFFVPFPKPKSDLERCKVWVKRCNRPHSQLNVEKISKDTYVCSKHFMGGQGPTVDFPDILADDGELKVPNRKRVKRPEPDFITTFPEAPKRKKAKQKAVSTCTAVAEEVGEAEGPVVEDGENQTLPEAVAGPPFIPLELDHSYTAPPPDEDHKDVLSPKQPSRRDASTQTDVSLPDLKEYSDVQLRSKPSLRRHLIMDRVLQDDRSCKHYTGLTLAILTLVLQLISPVAETLKYWRSSETVKDKEQVRRRPNHLLTIKEELVMTLMRLRRGLDVFTLGNLFGISKASVSRIFVTWVVFLKQHLQFLVKWPTREQVKARLPKAFKYFPNTRVIIDCTEFNVQKPSLPSSQRVTWSSYKHSNTFKVLVGTSPSGTFTFLSKLYTGSISDRKTIELSGFVDKLELGDDVMADRGFIIRDLVTLQRATLNIPPFAMGKQLSSQAVTKTRRIASARIHVERAIGRLKSFKILQGVISIKLRPILDEILFVCAALCNLDEKLVK